MLPKELTAMILSYVCNVKYFNQTNKLINTQKLIKLHKLIFPLWFQNNFKQILKTINDDMYDKYHFLKNNYVHFVFSPIVTSTSVKVYIRTKTFSRLNDKTMVHDGVKLITFVKKVSNQFLYKEWMFHKFGYWAYYTSGQLFFHG